MNPFDETPPAKDPTAAESVPRPTNGESAAHEISIAAASLAEPGAAIPQLQPAPAGPPVPEDLQITWSWPHFIVFVLFGFCSLLTIQTVLAFVLAPNRHMPPKELERYLLSDPKFIVGNMVILYAVLFLFLYITLSVLRGHPFWKILGWRKIQPVGGALPRNPIVYFLAGCGLSLFVAVISLRMKTPENVPIEELFKHRNTAIVLMAMAVLLAPLVEETLFRGYLYPLLARSLGIVPAIIVTGVCFGALHGSQDGWAWGLVAILIGVGIVFTIVRARTGSVLASYMMHLGYNSLIVFITILETHGFTKLPGQ